jgi:hypothetical protein
MKRKQKALELDVLCRLIKRGAESGPGIEAKTIFSRLRQKYVSLNKP